MRPCRRPRPTSRRLRRGVTTLELLVNLPVWLIAFLAVVEFGMIFANLQQVALASRVGAKVASESSSFSVGPLNPADPIVLAIEHQLQLSGITQCKIILEENAGGSHNTHTLGSCVAPPPPTPLPTLGKYVRVSVCVPGSQLAPNLLKAFFLDSSKWIFRETTTFHYELP